MDGLDEAVGRMRVAGGYAADDCERLQEIAAEMLAWELVVALQNAVNQQPHWRHEAWELLRRIARAELPKPLNEMGSR